MKVMASSDCTTFLAPNRIARCLILQVRDIQGLHALIALARLRAARISPAFAHLLAVLDMVGYDSHRSNSAARS